MNILTECRPRIKAVLRAEGPLPLPNRLVYGQSAEERRIHKDMKKL